MNALKNAVEKYGINNLRFFIPLMPIGFSFAPKEEEIIECEIVERQYPISSNFKVQFKPVNELYAARFGVKTYYITDFEAISHSVPDALRIYILTIDGYFRIYLNETF